MAFIMSGIYIQKFQEKTLCIYREKIIKANVKYWNLGNLDEHYAKLYFLFQNKMLTPHSEHLSAYFIFK